MNFVWCVVPSTIIACWFLFANRIGLLSCMTRRKYDIEWRSDHMSTGVSWWDENNSANLQSRPLELSLAGNTMGCHVSQSTHRLDIYRWSFLSGSSMVNASGPALTAVPSFCNQFWCLSVRLLRCRGARRGLYYQYIRMSISESEQSSSDRELEG